MRVQCYHCSDDAVYQFQWSDVSIWMPSCCKCLPPGKTVRKLPAIEDGTPTKSGSSLMWCKCGSPATVEFKSWEEPTAQGEGPLVWRPSCLACVPHGKAYHALNNVSITADCPGSAMTTDKEKEKPSVHEWSASGTDPEGKPVMIHCVHCFVEKSNECAEDALWTAHCRYMRSRPLPVHLVKIKSEVAAEKYLKRIARFMLPATGETVYEVMVDVYDVAAAYKITDGPLHHALKKILCPGQRGVKSEKQDLEEAIQSIRRQIELLDAKKE